MGVMSTPIVEQNAARPYTSEVPGKPKPPQLRKDRKLQVRLTDRQYEIFAQAAEDVGLTVSAWLRSLGIQATRERAKADEGRE
jgi:hypothetical protein